MATKESRQLLVRLLIMWLGEPHAINSHPIKDLNIKLFQPRDGRGPDSFYQSGLFAT